MNGKKPIQHKLKERLDPQKLTASIDNPDFWNSRRNSTHPLIVESPDAVTPKSILFKSQGAWRINFEFMPNLAGATCLMEFSNGVTIDMIDFGFFPGAVAEMLLDGQPYLKRDDEINITVTNGKLYILRDLITVNKETY